MTLVVDASAVIDLLVRSVRGDQVRAFLAGHTEEGLATVAHLDAEVFSGLARLRRAGELKAGQVAVLLGRLGELAVTRLPITTALLKARGGFVTTSPLGTACTWRPPARCPPAWSPPTTDWRELSRRRR